MNDDWQFRAEFAADSLLEGDGLKFLFFIKPIDRQTVL
jgi:hypothetical protein